MTLKSRRTSTFGMSLSALVFIATAALVVVPVAFMIVGSFSLARLPTDFSWGNMGLENYIQVWTARGIDSVLLNTIVFVLGAIFVATGIATMLAWLVERSDMPGKLWIFASVPLCLAVPGLLQGVAWVLLLSPRSGIISRFVMDTFGLTQPFINIYSVGGMIFVEGLRLVPLAFLLMIPIMRNMDPALEEAAATCGATPIRTALKITMWLLMPGIAATLLYQAISAFDAFEVPGVLGMSANIHVLSTRIYAIISSVGVAPSFGQANALAMLYLVIAVALALLYYRMIRHSYRYTVVSGKAYRPRLVQLGNWRWLAIGGVFLYLFLSVILPFSVLLYTSLIPFLQPPSAEAFESMSLSNYRRILADPRLTNAAINTFLIVVATSISVIVTSFVISYVIIRSRFALRGTLDLLAFLPHAIPATVLAIAFLVFFLTVDASTGIRSYGSLTSIVIGLVVVFMAYGTRTMNSALLQIHPDLQEAGFMSGATPFQIVRRIFIPLLMPTIIGLWLYVVILTIRITALPLMLARGSSNEVLASMIWSLWQNGRIETVAAIGVLLMLFMFFLSIGLRLLGFGRN